MLEADEIGMWNNGKSRVASQGTAMTLVQVAGAVRQVHGTVDGHCSMLAAPIANYHFS
jgi:hypothetical protein